MQAVADDGDDVHGPHCSERRDRSQELAGGGGGSRWASANQSPGAERLGAGRSVENGSLTRSIGPKTSCRSRKQGAADRRWARVAVSSEGCLTAGAHPETASDSFDDESVGLVASGQSGGGFGGASCSAAVAQRPNREESGPSDGPLVRRGLLGELGDGGVL